MASLAKSDAPVRFDHVTKRFRRGESATALRDALPNLLRMLTGRGKSRDQSEFVALDDLSFEVKRGEVLGLVGANGAGKSTTLKLVAGILEPNEGSVTIDGTLSALIEVGAGFHPDLTGRENIYLNGSVLGLKNAMIKERLDDIIDFAELRDFIDTPVKRYSSGMYMRLGFSIAVHVDPQILLIDEVLSVGDLAFRRKCLNSVQRMREAGKTILFVSHKMFDVRSICDRVLYLKGGKIHLEGTALDVTREFERDMLKKSLGDTTGLPTSQQSGTSRVVIDDVTVVDAAGAEIEEIKSGDPIRVRVSATANETIEEPILSVALLRSDGLRVCTASTRIIGPKIPTLAGDTQFEVVFDKIDLTEEYYTVETVIWNREMSIPIAQYLNPTLHVGDDAMPINRPGVYHAPARFVRVASAAGVVREES